MGKPGNDRRIDNIEFAVSDDARSRELYSKASGWTFTDWRLRQGRPDESWRAAGDTNGT